MFDLEAYIAAEHAEYDRRLKIHEEVENTLSRLEKEREAIEGRLSQSEDEKERLTQIKRDIKDISTAKDFNSYQLMNLSELTAYFQFLF